MRLPILQDTTLMCPDPGLQSIGFLSEQGEGGALQLGVWIGLAIAFEQSIHVARLVIRDFDKLRFRVTTTEHPDLPTGFMLLWVTFTSLSILTVGLTWRSNVAVLAKTLHVASECLLFVAISLAFSLYTLTSITLVVAVGLVLAALSLPCQSTIATASLAGLTFDTVNFAAYSIFFLSTRSKRVRSVCVALGFHFVYLIVLVLSKELPDLSTWDRANLRFLTLPLNIAANEVFLRFVQGEIRPTSPLIRSLHDWTSSTHVPITLWTEDGPSFANVGVEEAIVTLLDPHTSAFTTPKWFTLLLIPFELQAKVSDIGKVWKVHLAILWGYCFTFHLPKVDVSSCGNVYVIQDSYIRILYQILFALFGVVMYVLS